MPTPPPRRHILVTGAAAGLGRAIALRLARQGFGLALMDTAPALATLAHDIAQAHGVPVAQALADVADDGQREAALHHLRHALGRLDGLVNNAGIASHIAPLVRMDPARWQRELDVNLSAPFLLTQALLPDMVAAGWGRIVNISSLAARGGLFNQAGYSATKAGLLGLTRAVVLEHARHGITCNAVLPGLIETEPVKHLPPVIMDDALALTPARRNGQPDEVAALVAFLCGDDAAYINGAEIDISGGSHLCPVVLGSVREVQQRRAAAAPASASTPAQTPPPAPTYTPT